jgi:hypothetical protein
MFEPPKVEVLWSKVPKDRLPAWALALLQNLRGVSVVTDSDFVMWRAAEHMQITIDKVLSYAREGNLLNHRTYYSEAD